jgi:hypothetical protein
MKNFFAKIFSSKNTVRKQYQLSDIPKINSKNGEMTFGYNEEAFAHIAIQNLEKKTGQRLTEQEYKQVLDELKKESNYPDDAAFNFEDDPDYCDDQNEHIVHDAACSFLDFIENHSYSKVYPLFKSLLSNQEKLKELAATYPRYEKVSKAALKNIDEVSVLLKKFIKMPADTDLYPILKRQEILLFNHFKEYRESSMARFKKPEIINKHRTELVREIDEILANTDKDSKYYALFSEYKQYNLSIIKTETI